VGELTDTIQQIQERVTEIELQVVLINLQEVHDKREEVTISTFGRIRALASERKQLSDHIAHTYEHLTKDLEMRKLEAKL